MVGCKWMVLKWQPVLSTLFVYVYKFIVCVNIKSKNIKT